MKKGRGTQEKKATGYIPYSRIVDDDTASFNSQPTTDDFSFDDKDLTVWDALRSHGVSGLTAGYSDEIQAANEAGFKDYWRGDKRAEEIYNRRVAKERAYLKALEKKHPILSSIGYIAGSIVPTVASIGIPGLNF